MPRKAKYHLYWGDMHAQFKPQWAGDVDWDAFVEQSFRSARDYLDFFPIVYYPAFFYTTPQGLRTESVGWRDEFGPEWAKINALVRKYHEPGRFVTFAGYEWTGDRTRWGDHNVFYFDEGQPLDLSMTYDELCAHLRERRGIAIPHHTAYQVAERGKDWDHLDEEVSPFAEIFSVHGSSEGCDTPFGMARNVSMAPRVSGGSVQDGLARGYRLGIMASGDNGGGFAGKHGTGLVACYATELTREALWDAFLARRVYGVTGDRIGVDFRIGRHFMGEVLRSSGPATVRARVVGTQALDRIELVKDNRVVATHCHNGSWSVPRRGTVRLKLQVEHGWGPSAHYGFKAAAKTWRARLTTRRARILSVEGLFTRHGQSIDHRSSRQCSYVLTTSPRGKAGGGPHQQSVVFELEGPVDARVRLSCDEIEQAFTLRELMERSRVLPFRKHVAASVRKQFGLTASQFENPADAFYHNAYKIKLHKAIPERGYTAAWRFTDEKPRRGRSFYYLRVSQLNGQYAWSSPIWVERR